MTRWSRFSCRTGLAAVATVTLLAGCGGSQPWPTAAGAPGTSATKAVLESVRTTAAAQSARVSMRISMSGSESDSVPGFGATLDGAADFASGDMQLTIAFDGPMAEMFSGVIEMRVVDGVGYVKMPESMGGILGAPGGWLKVDASDLGDGDDPLALGGQGDPTQFLAYLETVSNGVEEVGSEVIRGVETTHYRASLDLGKAVDQADVPPELRDALRELQSEGGAAPVIPADVFVDGDGYVRRLELQLDMGSFMGGIGDLGSGEESPTASVSIDLYDFGVPVNVQAPPPDQVTTLPGLGDFGGLGEAEPTA